MSNLQIPRVLCDICTFKGLCKSKKITGCPCINCLIKSMCRYVCQDAAKYFDNVRENMILQNKKRGK